MGGPYGEGSASEIDADLSKMKIVKFDKVHAYQILEDNLNTGIKLTYNWEAMVEKWNESRAFTLTTDDDRLVMCGGILPGEWKQGEAWLLLGILFEEYSGSGYKAVKRTMDQLAMDMGLIRLQSHTLTTLVTAHHLLHHLVSKCEGWPRKAGPNQEDLFLFGKIYGEN